MPTFFVTGRIIKKYDNPETEFGWVEIRNHNHIPDIDPWQMKIFRSKFMSDADGFWSSLKEGGLYRFNFEPKVDIFRNKVRVDGWFISAEDLEAGQEEVSINDI